MQTENFFIEKEEKTQEKNYTDSNKDMILCGGSCSIKDRKLKKNLIGNEFKSIGTFHSDPLKDLINLELKSSESDSIPTKIHIDFNLEDTKKMKEMFMHDKNSIYFNHGAFGSPFLESFLFAEEIRRITELNPVKFFDRDLFPYLSKAIVKLSKFLNCDPFLLMPLANATSGLNAIFRSLDNLNNIVLFDTTYSATNLMIDEIYFKSNMSKNKYTINIPLKYLKNSKKELIDFVIDNIPNDSDLLIIDHISSQSAIVFPIKELIDGIRMKFTHRDIIILVDGAHASGSIKLDLNDLNCDFYVGNLHKWMCSCRGGGFLYINKKHIDKIKGVIVSHGHGNKNNLLESFYWDGNRDYSGFLSIIKTLEIWDILVKYNIFEFLKNKTKIFSDKICEELRVSRLYCFDNFNSTMTFVPLPERYQVFTPKTIQDWLHHQHNIEITIKNVYEKNCMRLSVHLYNSVEDLNKLIEILNDFHINL